MTRTEFLIEKERVMAKWKLLEEIVNLLENGDQPLDDSIKLFVEQLIKRLFSVNLEK